MNAKQELWLLLFYLNHFLNKYKSCFGQNTTMGNYLTFKHQGLELNKENSFHDIGNKCLFLWMLKESFCAYAVVHSILMRPLPFMVVFIIGICVLRDNAENQEYIS